MSENNTESDRVTFLEFYIPYVFEEERGQRGVPRTLTIDINMTGRIAEEYTEEKYGEYPPSSEEACRELARDLDKNFDEFISKGFIRDVMDDSAGINSIQELKKEYDNMFFVY